MTQEMRENYKKPPPPPLDNRQLDPNMAKMLQTPLMERIKLCRVHLDCNTVIVKIVILIVEILIF